MLAAHCHDVYYAACQQDLAVTWLNNLEIGVHCQNPNYKRHIHGDQFAFWQSNKENSTEFLQVLEPTGMWERRGRACSLLTPTLSLLRIWWKWWTPMAMARSTSKSLCKWWGLGKWRKWRELTDVMSAIEAKPDILFIVSQIRTASNMFLELQRRWWKPWNLFQCLQELRAKQPLFWRAFLRKSFWAAHVATLANCQSGAFHVSVKLTLPPCLRIVLGFCLVPVLPVLPYSVINDDKWW